MICSPHLIISTPGEANVIIRVHLWDQNIHQQNTRKLNQLRPSDGKVWFSLVQGLLCLNPELDHWFSSGIFLNLELNPWFRFKTVQFRFREGPNTEPNVKASFGGT